LYRIVETHVRETGIYPDAALLQLGLAGDADTTHVHDDEAGDLHGDVLVEQRKEVSTGTLQMAQPCE
jgi:hypothetical protein